MAYLPVRIANSGNSAADTMFWYSFKILPDRLKLIQLYPCGSLGPSISFIFGARSGHFAATPQSDVVRICAHDFVVMATLSVPQEMPFFSCIYNPQITISPTSSFSASFNGNRVQNHSKPWTPCLLYLHFHRENAAMYGHLVWISKYWNRYFSIFIDHCRFSFVLCIYILTCT